MPLNRSFIFYKYDEQDVEAVSDLQQSMSRTSFRDNSRLSLCNSTVSACHASNTWM